ncbi:MAG: Tol-Pal system beta propeller repeat protein TolB [Deltaproteobacteria bacterium RBG_16_47_11]|nr:MAG: Tol-Pal system beta propeller repeat protein TolB [Deltaproteobacteria bacterium RBG_16_47_11]
MMRFLTFFLFAFFLCSSAGEARVYLDVNTPTLIQLPIVLPRWKATDKTPPTLPAKIYEVLENDLTLSGFFRVINSNSLPAQLQKKEGIPSTLYLLEWMPAGGEILLAGETTLESEGLNLKLKFHLFDLVEQKHLVGKQYEGPIQNLRAMVHRMADEVILQLTGERGVNTTKIAYVNLQPGNKEIFISDIDGANIKQITRNQSINVSPVWAPDGKRIAFTSYLKRNPDLYLVDLDGKNLVRFLSHQGLNTSPSWSPDGKQIALMLGMEGKSDIYLVDANGGNPRKLTKGHGNEASPTWSPDGKSIGFVSDRSGSPQIYVMSVQGSEVRRITFEGSYNTQPSWSPKGDRIAFCGRVGGRYTIFAVKPDGTGLQRLTSNAGDNENPCWSPDGRYLAFSSTRTGAPKIFIMHANSLNPRPLTQAKGGELSPAWSRRFD